MPEDEAWYLSSGQGMGMTLTLADQKRAYTLTDRGTFLARAPLLQSRILFEGDPLLLNLYHVMPVKAEAFPAVDLNTAGAAAFVEFLLSPEAQETIASFGIEDYGQPLFIPAAGHHEEDRLVVP
jgi:tungstate transport system substrate-binding protein